jgi:hypothetical protein
MMAESPQRPHGSLCPSQTAFANPALKLPKRFLSRDLRGLAAWTQPAHWGGSAHTHRSQRLFLTCGFAKRGQKAQTTAQTACTLSEKSPRNVGDHTF